MKTTKTSVLCVTLVIVTLAIASLSTLVAQEVSQDLVASPRQTIPELTLEQALQNFPVAHKPQRRPHTNMDKLIEEFNEHHQKELKRRNRRLHLRFAALQRAGGWQQAYLGQLAHARATLPGSIEQLDAAQRFITNFVFCSQPLIASVVSEFEGGVGIHYWVDKDYVVEPLASIVINGCNFGARAGEVRLIMNQDNGSFIPLQVRDWSDGSIFATLGRNPGIPDQNAQLVVVRSDGTMSYPAPVQFFQHRVAQTFDVRAHAASVGEGSTAHTTRDKMGVFIYPEGGSGIFGGHYTFCCSAVSGTDRWFFLLKNGWQIPPSSVLFVPQFYTVTELGQFLYLRSDGLRDCGLFSSGEGRISHVSILGPPGDFPEFQSEVDISWEAGSNCSGVFYDAEVSIWGPEGVPYE